MEINTEYMKNQIANEIIGDLNSKIEMCEKEYTNIVKFFQNDINKIELCFEDVVFAEKTEQNDFFKIQNKPGLIKFIFNEEIEVEDEDEDKKLKTKIEHTKEYVSIYNKRAKEAIELKRKKNILEKKKEEIEENIDENTDRTIKYCDKLIKSITKKMDEKYEDYLDKVRDYKVKHKEIILPNDVKKINKYIGHFDKVKDEYYTKGVLRLTNIICEIYFNDITEELINDLKKRTLRDVNLKDVDTYREVVDTIMDFLKSKKPIIIKYIYKEYSLSFVKRIKTPELKTIGLKVPKP